VTPLPEDCCIQVQPDDVLGFFVDNPNNEKNGVVAIDRIDGDPIMYSSDKVWYGNIQGYTPSDSECPYSVGTQTGAILNTMRGAAPVISLAMSK
jgi:guanyl-specific ribonuclease Sa